MDLIYKKMMMLEIPLVITSLLGIVLKLNGIEINSILIISLSSLSALYFLNTYIPKEFKNLFEQIISKVSGIACSVCLIGILFVLMKFPGGDNMLILGFSTNIICTFLLAFYWMSSKNQNILYNLIRSFTLTLLGIFFLLMKF